MTLRDAVGALTGASFSFLIALVAYSKHPVHVVKWGLGISLCLLAAAFVGAVLRAPWLSATIVNLGPRPDGRLALRLFLNVHGYGTLGTQIVNLLVPQSLHLERTRMGGEPHDRHRELWLTDNEEVDSEQAVCFDDKVEFGRGVHLFNFAVSPGERTEMAFVLNVMDRRTSWRLPVQEVGVEHTVNYAAVRARLESCLAEIGKRLKRSALFKRILRGKA